MVLANLVVTRRLVAPLEALVRVMREVDLMKPGSRVSVGGTPSEATELAETFNAMLDRLESEREESMRRVIGAQESERLRVAQELHDEIGQNLTAALLQLARVRKQAGPELQDEVGAATETVRANLDDLRRIAQRLRPQALDELGLTSALPVQRARSSVQAGLEIEAHLDSQLPPLTREEELVIYRVAQEALTNIVRHADATHSELVLERAPDRADAARRRRRPRPRRRGARRRRDPRHARARHTDPCRPARRPPRRRRHRGRAPRPPEPGRPVVPLKTRILLADDHTIVRQGLRFIIDAEPDLEVVAEASNGHEAVTRA